MEHTEYTAHILLIPRYTLNLLKDFFDISRSETTGPTLIQCLTIFFSLRSLGGMPLHLVRTDTIPSIMSVLHLAILIANKM